MVRTRKSVTDGWTDGRTDRQTDRQTESSKPIVPILVTGRGLITKNKITYYVENLKSTSHVNLAKMDTFHSYNSVFLNMGK